MLDDALKPDATLYERDFALQEEAQTRSLAARTVMLHCGNSMTAMRK